ncbi:SDR family oxidoreductase [Spirosoma sp. KUDC1026]|uniref:SDR family oxidoreductase n=1 Tax=Spirosoma sp. KUDC1026 TaxID=2745947 RepID=UPI00159BA6EB|nr:SDR family oxidoreductase [Spirosoma sp. KUDC1026]QKZ12563.1 SDR family oxidoreductase [Spirosoma sp. KUDC1026]
METQANSAAQTVTKANAPTLLITGATGTIGQAITKLLSERGIPFRAMVRSRQKADQLAALPGTELVEGDFNDPASLAQALAGIERAFLLTNSSEQAEAQQLAFVTEAKRAGVPHIVKLSQFAAAADSPVRFLRYHAVVEQTICESGITYTFLRPNLFMQGLLGFRQPIVEQGKFFAAIGDAKISAIDIRDIAAVAVAALTEKGHDNKTYTLTGPEALTHAEMAEQLSTALSRHITFVDVPPEAMHDALIVADFPEWQAEALLEDYAHYSRNEASAVTTDVQDVTGKPARTFIDFARDYAPAF